MTQPQKQRELEMAERYAEAARKQLAMDQEKLAQLKSNKTYEHVAQ